jgi:hypothetical protein
LGRVEVGYVYNLSKKHHFSRQFPVERFIKDQKELD